MNCSYEHMDWSPEMLGKLDVLIGRLGFQKLSVEQGPSHCKCQKAK